jgi:hypothetical protein
MGSTYVAKFKTVQFITLEINKHLQINCTKYKLYWGSFEVGTKCYNSDCVVFMDFKKLSQRFAVQRMLQCTGINTFHSSIDY